MRLWSTHESIRRGEPTVLAIIEAVAAMATSIWIGVYFNTWTHIAVGFCIAPFLLLRTDESCEQAIESFQKCGKYFSDRSDSTEGIAAFWNLLVAMLWIGFCGMPVRFWATVSQLCRDPINSLHALPGNWWRTVLMTDFAVSPEYIPNPQVPSETFAEFAKNAETDEFTYLYSAWKVSVTKFAQEEEIAVRLVVGAMFGVLLTGISIFALAYRWSIKSTAIGWSPLLWALKPVKPKSGSWKKKFDIELDSRVPQFIAVWSFFCLALLTVKYFAWALKVELANNRDAWRAMFAEWTAMGGWREKVAASPLADALINFVRPGGLPPWDVAIFFNAILGIYIWWQVRSWALHYKHDAPPTDDSVRKTLGVVFFFRHLLVCYIILCDGLIIWQAARKLPVPAIDWHLLPL